MKRVTRVARSGRTHRIAPGTAITAATFVLLSVSTAMAAERRVDPRVPPSSPVHAAKSAPAADADDSVAVVAFSNITGAAEDDWIGRGIAEALTADLEGVGSVLVVGHQAVSGALETLSTGRGASAAGGRAGNRTGRRCN